MSESRSVRKTVYLITNYIHFPSEKSSNRYLELAKMLSAESDIDLVVITSRFYHRKYQYRSDLDALRAEVPFKVVFVDEREYHKNISLKRIMATRDFGKNVMKYIKSNPKPDLIYQVIPTPFVADAVSRYANKNGIPLILDIQDLWPEAFKMALNVPVLSDLAFLPFKIKAEGAYRRADAICAVSSTYVDRALSVNKKGVPTAPVYIGINLSDFDRHAEENRREKTERLTLAYCGALSKSYDIKLVIDALALMSDAPRFLVMGDGNSREEFEAYAKEKDVDVTFTGFLSYPEMCGMLCSADMTVNPIIGASVASIINKHGDYAACGLPVINTQNSPEYMALIDEYEMGFNCVGTGAEDLASKIDLLMKNRELRDRMGRNSRKCAEERFDRSTSYKKLVDMVRSLLK